MAHVPRSGVPLMPVTGFGFVEFESSRDAEDAVQNFNGKSFMGAKYDRQLIAEAAYHTD